MRSVIVLVILALLVFWAISAYNRLIRLKNQVLNCWQQIDVQLKRRHDLIPNLVDTVKGAMDFERDTLEGVVQARSRAVNAQGVKQVAQAEGALTQALGKLFALSEAYPELKSLANVSQLQTELAGTENKIAAARLFYNEAATMYNIAQAQFPTNMIAGMAHANTAELWEIEQPTDRAVPDVDLSID